MTFNLVHVIYFISRYSRFHIHIFVVARWTCVGDACSHVCSSLVLFRWLECAIYINASAASCTTTRKTQSFAGKEHNLISQICLLYLFSIVRDDDHKLAFNFTITLMWRMGGTLISQFTSRFAAWIAPQGIVRHLSMWFHLHSAVCGSSRAQLVIVENQLHRKQSLVQILQWYLVRSGDTFAW